MNTLKDATDENFDALVLKPGGIALVDFWAPWARPCQQLEPVVCELASELDGRVRMYRVNTDESPRTAERFGIETVPTMVIFSEGKVLSSLIGARSKAAIRDALLLPAAG